MDRVEAPKVHASKLRQGAGVIYGEDMLMLHGSYSVAVYTMSCTDWGVYTTTGTGDQGHSPYLSGK